MAKACPTTRVTLQLDPRVALEAILLNRLGQLPTGRRQEWLRGLLVQGFRNECQALRGLSSEPGQVPTGAFRRAPAPPKPPPATDARPSEPLQFMEAEPGDKPFAALRRVIG